MGRVINFNERMPVLEVAGGCIVSKTGDITMGLALEKPEIFTLGTAEYALLHEAFVKSLKLLAPGTIVHFQDIYWEDHWRPGEGTVDAPVANGANGFGGAARVGGETAVHADNSTWLAGASDRFFTGRRCVRNTAFCYLTLRPAGRKAVNSAGSGLSRRWLVPPDTLDERSAAELREKVRQFSKVLADSGLVGVRLLTTEELKSTGTRAGLIEQYCYLLEGQRPVLRDIDFRDGLRVGSREAVLFTLGDAAHLPSACSPAMPYDKYSGETSKVYTGFLSGLGLLLPGNHLVNTYIIIGDGPATWARMEKKRLRMHSLSKYSRSNALAAEAAGAFLGEGIREQRVPAHVHVNVLAWADAHEQLPELRARLVSAIAALGAVPHEETIGAPQLWWAGIPGNAGDLPENECWETFLEQACCFLEYEANYRDSPGTFGVRFGDRLTGRPVLVDLDIEPRQRNWTQNNNMLILATSGAGKSFATAHVSNTFYRFGGHVVIVDVGHSYRGLCRLLNGKYFTYEVGRPLFNPFKLEAGEELDIDKMEAIKSLLVAIWKRPDEAQYRSEYVALSNILQAYYRRLKERPDIFPCFNTFYEFLRDDYSQLMRQDGVRQKEFDLDNFLYVVRPYYSGGEFDFLLNAWEELGLLQERFVVFELDRIKSHPILLPVVALVVAEAFLAKTRKLLGVRKMLVIEEAWKAIANAGLADNIKEWEKTLRKYMAKIALVSQEMDDIIDSPVLKETAISCSDVRILLDQSKFQNRFGALQAMMGITEKQKAEILSINRGHDPGRPYKDLWIGFGTAVSHVYRLEVSAEEYWVYTSEQGDKVRLEEYVAKCGGYREGVEGLVGEGRRS